MNPEMRREDHDTGERVCPDRPDENFENHVRVYRFAMQFVAGRRVLDMGCGSGYGSHLFTTQGAERVEGIDNADEAITYARCHYTNPRLRFEVMDAQALRFADGAFDMVFSSETLEHVADARRCVAEARRVLRRGGLLVLGTPNSEISSPGMAVPPNPYHVREFSFEELEALVGEFFADVHIFETLLEPPNDLGRQLRDERRRRGKVGLEPGAAQTIRLSDVTIDLRELHNTHSFMVLAR